MISWRDSDVSYIISTDAHQMLGICDKKGIFVAELIRIEIGYNFVHGNW
jgi:hypothetical protein